MRNLSRLQASIHLSTYMLIVRTFSGLIVALTHSKQNKNQACKITVKFKKKNTIVYNNLLPQLLLTPHNGNDEHAQRHSCQVHILSDTKRDKNFLPRSELRNTTNLESFYCSPTAVTLS